MIAPFRVLFDVEHLERYRQIQSSFSRVCEWQESVLRRNVCFLGFIYVCVEETKRESTAEDGRPLLYAVSTAK